MTDPATPEEYGLRAAKRQLKKDNASLVEQNLALRSKVSALAAQLKAAQKVIEAARELDWDSYAEGQGKPEVDLSGLWDSLAAQLEEANARWQEQERPFDASEFRALRAQLEATEGQRKHLSGLLMDAQKAIGQLEADVEHRDEIIQRLRSGKAE